MDRKYYLIKWKGTPFYIAEFCKDGERLYTRCQYQAYKAKKLETIFRKLEKNKIKPETVEIIKVDFDELEEEIRRRYGK